MALPATWKEWISAGIAVIVLIGFISVFVVSILWSFNPPMRAEDPEEDKLTFAATVLAGIVTTVVATALGVPPASGTRLQRVGRTAARMSPEDTQTVIAIAYSVAYALAGTAAVVCWIFAGALREEVHSLSLTFFGFIAAIVKSRF